MSHTLPPEACSTMTEVREGMEVVTTVDRKSFEDAVAPAYEEYYKRFDKKLIEDIRNTR